MAGGGGSPTGTTQTSLPTGTPTTSPSGATFVNTPLSTSFSEQAYLASNPDVAGAIDKGDWKQTALAHYLQYGQNEGRTPYAGAQAGQTVDVLNRPFNEQAYLTNNPDVARAIAAGTFGGTGREHYLQYGQGEGRAPSNVANRGSSVTTPSYYNTNPFSVNYANIFNPRAGSVLSANPMLTPQQQSNYLAEWQSDYNNRINSGLEAAQAARVAEAQRAQDAYNTARAAADAQAAAATQAAIDKAVQDRMSQYGYQQPSDNYNYGWYTGASGGIASLEKGFKR